MSGILIKCDRDPESDRYVYWSEVCEAPHIHGDRAHITRYLETVERNYGGADEIAERFERADRTGTSSFPRFYDWNDGTLIVEQRGILRREKLWDFCVAYCTEDPARRDEWLDMLEPFDDCRAHFDEEAATNNCPVLPCPDHTVWRD